MSTPREPVIKREPGSNGSPAASSPGLGGINGANGKDQKTENGWQEIPLKCYSEDDIKDRRYHIAKFTNKSNVDIVKDFNKPVRLHRKDPRNLQFHLSRKEIEIKKREQQQRATEKAKRKQQRISGIPVDDDDEEEEKQDIPLDEVGLDSQGLSNQMDISQVAPEGGARNVKKSFFKQQKTRQINLMDEKKRKLRYEEFYPWVMEDYDGKNVYVGNYEAGASEATHVLFVIDKDGFKMVPAEKVYRFNPRNKYATLTLEEAEARMEKKSAVPRWLMKHMEDKSVEGGDKDYRFRNGSGAANRSTIRNNRMRTVAGETANDRDSDHDDIDFEEEFADDEEAPIMDGDEEENKLSEQKIKKEMLKAAHFDGQSDAEDDLDDLFETEKSRKMDKEGKKLRKVLNKTEGEMYESDEDEDGLNPYLSKSDLESDDDSDRGITVKEELDADFLKHKNRRIFAHDVGDGFVVIKAPAEFLAAFPRGEWLPNGRKRAVSTSTDSPQKKQKTDKSTSPQPSNMDLDDAGPDGTLVTVSEVLDIVKVSPLPTKELLVRLRNRVNANKENRQRIIAIVKKNLKLEDGKLVLRD